MITAPIYNNEKLRLQEVQSLEILDTPPDIRYDSITQLAVEMLQVPISFIALIDSQRQWFKSVRGVDMQEIPRSTSICAHAICEIKSSVPKERIFNIPNLKNDIRFVDNPYVISGQKLQSHLSYVLQSESGENIGTFCITDTKPREFTDSNIQIVTLLGTMTENLLYGRHHLYGLEDGVH